jgi:glycosyltransferase involved in cell wall biosynthesis
VSAGHPKLAKGQEADVMLLLEGTYPYVSGGVSSWVHQIIRGLPELTFSIVFLGANRESYGKMRYELPKNLVHLEVHYIMETWRTDRPRSREGNQRAFEDARQMHEFFRSPTGDVPDDLFARVMSTLGTAQGIAPKDFLHSRQSWSRIREDYLSYCTDPSFVDYFWTVRTMHGPLFTLAEIARNSPPAKVIHSISTGYAGLLGAMLRFVRKRPYVLTEHGIYTKERKIDLAHAEWIKDAREAFGGGLDDDVSYIRRLWIRFFEGLGRMAYAAADKIVALYEGNRRRQVTDGAEEVRTAVIPNGIDLDRFGALRKKRVFHSVSSGEQADAIPKVLGLLGRVVPIKDIRTFVRAMRTVITRMPEAEGWVIGPEDEDQAYARECRELAHNLGLGDKMKFLGFQKPDDILPKLGLMMLTSISEALPLVLLEGYAAGVPTVATDVGSCRELVEGGSAEDKALGHSGAIVPIADPEATAAAAIKLLSNPEDWRKAQAAGIARVEQFYTQKMMYDAYRTIYRDALEGKLGRDRVRAA